MILVTSQVLVLVVQIAGSPARAVAAHIAADPRDTEKD
jgi:hypothetical protein